MPAMCVPIMPESGGGIIEIFRRSEEKLASCQHILVIVWAAGASPHLILAAEGVELADWGLGNRLAWRPKMPDSSGDAELWVIT